MMLIILLFCTLGGIAHAEIYELKLEANVEKRMTHFSSNGTSESVWNVKTCEGCKINLFCYVYSQNCEDHKLTIFDGKIEQIFCGPRRFGSIILNSVYNKMKITILTKGPIQGSMCHARTSFPYTNIEYKEIDSSEHGLGTGASKQTSCKCGWANKNPRRIVGGQETLPNEYPFATILKLKDDNIKLCGGSIISANHVLTAAHCTYPFRGLRFSVVVGEHDYRTTVDSPQAKEIDVLKTIEYPEYKERSNENDIAIALLAGAIEFNQFVGPVCMPNARTNLVGEYIKVMGWGRLMSKGQSSHVLRKVNLKVIDIKNCQALFENIHEKDRNQICTYAPDRDSCQGDSGGPLVWRNPETNRFTQVALVSYGHACASTDPAVNTDVSYFIDWIKQTIAETVPQELCH